MFRNFASCRINGKASDAESIFAEYILGSGVKSGLHGSVDPLVFGTGSLLNPDLFP